MNQLFTRKTGSILLLSMALYSLCGYAGAEDVTIKWNKRPESSITSYYVSYGTSSRNYTSSVNAGNTAQYTFPSGSLTTGTTYYFAVRSRDTQGQYSSYSQEVSVTVEGGGGSNPPPPGDIIVYENAEDGSASGWSAFGTTAGSSITNVYDSAIGSRVMAFSGSGLDTGFQLTGPDTDWPQTYSTLISWDIRYSEPFRIFINVDTTGGSRTMYYTNDDTDMLYLSWGNGYIHHGLGSSSINGSWHTFTRDLQADLEEALPGHTITAVTSFSIRGSGRIDNIVFNVDSGGSTPPSGDLIVYEDAEDGSASGWNAFGTTAGSSITNVYDSTAGSRVMVFSGSGLDTGFQLTGPDVDWPHTSSALISWDIRYSEPFRVFINVDTTSGPRTMYYTNDDTDMLYLPWGSGYIHHGLGSSSINGSWHTFTRDLQADLTEALPGITITAVTSFSIRGSGRVDNIAFGGGSGGTADLIVYEDAQDGSANGWDAYGETAGASITNIYDSVSGSRVINVAGSGLDTGYRLTEPDISWPHTSSTVMSWDIRYSEPFRIYVSVDTSSGSRTMYYTNDDTDMLYLPWGSGYVHHGLGSSSMNGSWHTFTRDLQADLAEALPGITINAVTSFAIRGSGRIDNIVFGGNSGGSTPPQNNITVYENAEDGATTGWSTYGNTSGASVANIYDSSLGSRVIRLLGNGTDTGYILAGPDGGSWNNSDYFNLFWHMRYSEEFEMFVVVETSQGRKTLWYTCSDTSRGYLPWEEGYIHIGLGSNIIDGSWKGMSRNLVADVTSYLSGATVLSVDEFKVRGSGLLDNILLSQSTYLSKPAQPTLTEELRPESFSLGQNSPNPFNGSTTISFTLPEQSHITLDIYNITGQKVAELISETRGVGTYSEVWHPGNLASGTYFMVLNTSRVMLKRKMLYIK